jgi:hypothetical protein
MVDIPEKSYTFNYPECSFAASKMYDLDGNGGISKGSQMGEDLSEGPQAAFSRCATTI